MKDFKLHHRLKNYSNFDELDGFCQVVELYQEGSATDRAPPSKFDYVFNA